MNITENCYACTNNSEVNALELQQNMHDLLFESIYELLKLYISSNPVKKYVFDGMWLVVRFTKEDRN